jgi:hypothetical protein
VIIVSTDVLRTMVSFILCIQAATHKAPQVRKPPRHPPTAAHNPGDPLCHLPCSPLTSL